MSLFGFTSTSEEFSQALRFLDPSEEDYNRIIIKINWDDLFNHYHIAELSRFPEEKEVILSDGVKFIVENIEPD